MTDTTFQAIRCALARPVGRWSTRRDLARLLHNPERLSDIGVSRKSALTEIRKPFWEE